MAFNLFSQLKKKESLVNQTLFYLSVALLTSVVFFCGLLVVKIYFFQQPREAYLDTQIASYGTNDQKAYEKKYKAYEKEISDFSAILNNHKISSNILIFIEDKTLAQVWFSNFDLSGSFTEIKLSGEAENLDVLANQVHAFETSEYVQEVSVLNSESLATGKVRFIMTLALDPKIFTYTSNPLFLYK